MDIFKFKKFSKITSHNAIYYALSIFVIVTLAWFLKNYLKVGDEVVAAVSASLITLFGVYLTNKNSQLALDKQLLHQKETFMDQLKDQAEGFKEQIKHQNLMLDKQLSHQSKEKEKERNQKFKHEIYTNLAKQLSEIETFFTKNMFIELNNNELLNKLSELSGYLNTAKTVSNHILFDIFAELHSKCCDIATKFNNENSLLLSLKQEEKSKTEITDGLSKLNSKLIETLLTKESQSSFISEVQLILKEREKINNELLKLNYEIAVESKRLIEILKSDIQKVKEDAQVIIMLINIEQGYNTLDDLLNNQNEKSSK